MNSQCKFLAFDHFDSFEFQKKHFWKIISFTILRNSIWKFIHIFGWWRKKKWATRLHYVIKNYYYLYFILSAWTSLPWSDEIHGSNSIYSTKIILSFLLRCSSPIQWHQNSVIERIWMLEVCVNKLSQQFNTLLICRQMAQNILKILFVHFFGSRLSIEFIWSTPKSVPNSMNIRLNRKSLRNKWTKNSN